VKVNITRALLDFDNKFQIEKEGNKSEAEIRKTDREDMGVECEL
jgi:hypothetical protein